MLNGCRRRSWASTIYPPLASYSRGSWVGWRICEKSIGREMAAQILSIEDGCTRFTRFERPKRPNEDGRSTAQVRKQHAPSVVSYAPKTSKLFLPTLPLSPRSQPGMGTTPSSRDASSRIIRAAPRPSEDGAPRSRSLRTSCSTSHGPLMPLMHCPPVQIRSLDTHSEVS